MGSFPSLLFMGLEAEQPLYNSPSTFSTSPSPDTDGTIPRSCRRPFQVFCKGRRDPEPLVWYPCMLTSPWTSHLTAQTPGEAPVFLLGSIKSQNRIS